MKVANYKSFSCFSYAIALVMLIAPNLFSVEPSKTDVNALNEYQAGNWKSSLQLASIAIREAKNISANNWSYSDPERCVTSAEFLGEHVLLTTTDRESFSDDAIEVHSVVGGKEIARFKLGSWTSYGSQSLQAYDDQCAAMVLHKRNSTKHKLLIVNGKNLRKPIEVKFDCEFLSLRNCVAGLFYLLKVGENGAELVCVDSKNGEVRSIAPIQHATLEQGQFAYFYGPTIKGFSTFNEGERNFYIDGRSIFEIEKASGSSKLIGEFSFDASDKDFWEPPYYCSLQDGAFARFDVLDPAHKSEKWLMPVSSTDKYPELAYDLKNNRIAQVIGDSLYLMKIEPERISVETALRSVGTKLYRRGRLIINEGRNGLQIIDVTSVTFEIVGMFDGDEIMLLNDSSETTIDSPFGSASREVMTAIIASSEYRSDESKGESEILFYYESPGRLAAYNVESKENIWEKFYFTFETEGRLYYYGDDYLWLDGASTGNQYLIDARDGSLVYSTPNRWGMKRAEFDQSASHYFLLDDWEVPLFEMHKRGVPEDQLQESYAIAALASHRLGDNSTAFAFAERALSRGRIVSDRLKEELYGFLKESGKVPLATNVAGQLLLSTGDDRWRDALSEGGVELVSDPFMGESHVIYKTGNQITAWSDWGVEDYLATDRQMPIFTVTKHDPPSASDYPILTAFSVNTPAGPIIYSYNKNPETRTVEWTPMLLGEEGMFCALPLLPATPYNPAYEPSKINRVHWWIPGGTSPGKDGFILTEFLPWGLDSVPRESYVVGIDATGERPSWADTTAEDPVRAGDHLFVHSQGGERVQNIIKKSQAERIGLKVDDIILGMGSYRISGTLEINAVKKLYPLGAKVKLSVLRGNDTLTFEIENGTIGINTLHVLTVSEVNSATGVRLKSWPIPKDFHYACCNTEGTLIYQNQNRLYFFDPYRGISKTAKIKGLEEVWMGPAKDRFKTFWMPLETDKIALQGSNEQFFGLDLATDVKDSKRILWKQKILNLHDAAFTDDPELLPIIMKSGEFILLKQATGEIVWREMLPFRHLAEPSVEDGMLIGAVEGRVVAWKIGYYQKR